MTAAEVDQPFAGLAPPYATIVADPPWEYDGKGTPGTLKKDGTPARMVGEASYSRMNAERRPRLGWDSWGKGYEL